MFGAIPSLNRCLCLRLGALLLISTLQMIGPTLAARCDYEHHLGLHVPSTNDCHHIISQMPYGSRMTNQTSLPYDHIPYGRVHDPSHPFFPQAQFLHQSCLIKVSYHPDALRELQDLESFQYSLDYPDLIVFLKFFEYPKPMMALHESSIMFIWDAIKATASHIIERCVKDNTTGLDWVWLDLAEDLWLVVEVVARGPDGEWPERIRETGPKTLMAVGVGPQFRKALYEV